VVDYDFATPWMQFFDSLLQSTTNRRQYHPFAVGGNDVILVNGDHGGAA
jgi:DNA gyrase inhibitor